MIWDKWKIRACCILFYIKSVTAISQILNKKHFVYSTTGLNTSGLMSENKRKLSHLRSWNWSVFVFSKKIFSQIKSVTLKSRTLSVEPRSASPAADWGSSSDLLPEVVLVELREQKGPVRLRPPAGLGHFPCRGRWNSVPSLDPLLAQMLNIQPTFTLNFSLVFKATSWSLRGNRRVGEVRLHPQVSNKIISFIYHLLKTAPWMDSKNQTVYCRFR